MVPLCVSHWYSDNDVFIPLDGDSEGINRESTSTVDGVGVVDVKKSKVVIADGVPVVVIFESLEIFEPLIGDIINVMDTATIQVRNDDMAV